MSNTDVPHTSVLLAEVLEMLAPRPGGRYGDGTLGYGGHAEAVLNAIAPDGRLWGIDRDENALGFARSRLAGFGQRVQFVHGRFSTLKECLEGTDALPLDGLLVDLGVSSPQLDRPERGFSFLHDGPLDMRMDTSSGQSAAALIATLPENELADVIYQYGEERLSRRIARFICEARQTSHIDTTGALAALVARAVPRRERKHPATRTFQALRIAVNDELGELDRFLTEAPSCLAPGGRLLVISFHSLEDRMVKHRMRALAKPIDGSAPHFRLLTKRPVIAGEIEEKENPRARSAKLRGLQRLPQVQAP